MAGGRTQIDPVGSARPWTPSRRVPDWAKSNPINASYPERVSAGPTVLRAMTQQRAPTEPGRAQENSMTRRLVLSFLLVTSLLGCSESTPPADTSLLGWVDVATPYAYVSGQPYPEATLARMGKLNSVAMASVEEALTNDPSIPPELAAIALELLGGMTNGDMEALGRTASDPYVLYARGLYPVARLQISDPAKLRATLAKIEEGIGSEIPTATRSGTTYWRLAGDDFDFMGVAMLDNDVLSVAIGPKPDEAGMVDHLLSDPSAQAATQFAARVEKLRADYELGPYDVFFAEPTALVERVLPLASTQPDCQGELLGYAKAVPIVAGGYTQFTARSLEFRMIVALDDAAREGLRGTLTPIPGGALGEDMLLSLGLGVDAAAAARGIAASMQEINATSKCGSGTDISESLDRLQTAQGALAVAGSPQGLRLVWDDFSMGQSGVPRLDALLVAEMRNPGSVLGLLQAQGIRLDDLGQDGTPITLNDRLPQVLPIEDTVWLAGRTDAVGLAIGTEKQGPRLRGALSGDSLPAGTMFEFAVSGRLFGMLADPSGPLGAMLATQTAHTPGMNAQLDVFRAYADVFDRFAYEVALTDLGVEVKQIYVLRE